MEKDKRNFSAARRFKDYPISPSKFRWVSPANLTPDSKRGSRLINHDDLKIRVLLAARTARENSIGYAQPYLLLGDVKLEKFWGEKPVQVDWDLHRAMPAKFFDEQREAP
ncbi:DUF3427 domain-containing protein [Corynebacterium sp. CCUG 70398]|nr:DUF3427 domain-containing protein [Corynebacterium sp. CCUG 70398]